MALACDIYNLEDSDASPKELELLLDRLRSTVIAIPPFAPGENSLVWVLFVAASKSSATEHCSFFTLRLVELLRRVNHDQAEG